MGVGWLHLHLQCGERSQLGVPVANPLWYTSLAFGKKHPVSHRRWDDRKVWGQRLMLLRGHETHLVVPCKITPSPSNYISISTTTGNLAIHFSVSSSSHLQFWPSTPSIFSTYSPNRIHWNAFPTVTFALLLEAPNVSKSILSPALIPSSFRSKYDMQ